MVLLVVLVWRYGSCMTAKEKLRQTVEDLSEAEAQDALGASLCDAGGRSVTLSASCWRTLRSMTSRRRLRRTRALLKPERRSLAAK
jgi:hypothetical protein